MTRHHGIELAVFVVGVGIGIACAGDTNAQTPERIVPDDTVAVARLLNVVRGANPRVCEMTVRSVDMHGSWSSWGSDGGGDPLVTDSASAALLDWVRRKHNDPVLVPPLRTAMRDGDNCVRRVAGALLARVQHSSAVSALLAALDDAQAGTREVAALGLGMADVHSAAGALEQRLQDDAPAVRRAAAWSLGQLEVKAAMPALIRVLARDPDARVRQTAAWAIGSVR
jgi:HEAT repeat protein